MGKQSEPLQFRVLGMDCAEEVTALKRELVSLVGDEQRLAFDVLRGKMTVTPGEPEITADHIVKGIQRAGLRAEPWKEEDSRPAATDQGIAASLRFWLVVASGMATLAGVVSHAALAGSLTAALGGGVSDHAAPTLISRMLYALAILAGVWLVLPKAWNAARHLRPDMNLLMVIAVCGAILIGEWSEGATVAFLFALSILLEAWSIGRARRAIKALLDIAPPEVRVRGENNTESTLSPEQVSVGCRFLVRPGERIPLDGRVVAGSSHVNQAPITGESRLVSAAIAFAVEILSRNR